MRTPNETVSLVIMNDQETYTAVCEILSRLTAFDEERKAWTGIDEAAEAYRALVIGIDPETPGFSDLAGIDPDDGVDWRQLVVDELYEYNLGANRPGTQGLPGGTDEWDTTPYICDRRDPDEGRDYARQAPGKESQ